MSNEQTKRQTFQQVKTWSNERFWNWMNQIHSEAYFKAVGHYREAAEVVLPPRLQKQLHDKAVEIREQWDGIATVNVKLEEMTLQDILLAVQREMARAAGIHGAEFSDLAEAREAIDEEYREVWEAIDQGDQQHAGVEAVQLIGVIVKLMRGLNDLVAKGA